MYVFVRQVSEKVGKDRKWEIHQLLIHSSNTCKSLGWAKLMPGARTPPTSPKWVEESQAHGPSPATALVHQQEAGFYGGLPSDSSAHCTTTPTHLREWPHHTNPNRHQLKNVIHSYETMLFGSADTYCGVCESWKPGNYHAEGAKPARKQHILLDSTYMKYAEQETHADRKQISDHLALSAGKTGSEL